MIKVPYMWKYLEIHAKRGLFRMYVNVLGPLPSCIHSVSFCSNPPSCVRTKWMAASFFKFMPVLWKAQKFFLIRKKETFKEFIINDKELNSKIINKWNILSDTINNYFSKSVWIFTISIFCSNELKANYAYRENSNWLRNVITLQYYPATKKNSFCKTRLLGFL